MSGRWPIRYSEPGGAPSGRAAILRGLVGAVALAFVVAVLVVALSGCGSSDNDVKIKTRDTTGATVLNMPNEFPSVATKCDGKGHRIYVTNRYDNGAGAAVTAIDDRNCTRVGP